MNNTQSVLPKYKDKLNSLKIDETNLLNALSKNRAEQRQLLLLNCKQQHGFGIGDKIKHNGKIGVIINIFVTDYWIKIQWRWFNANGKESAYIKTILLFERELEMRNIEVIEEKK